MLFKKETLDITHFFLKNPLYGSFKCSRRNSAVYKVLLYTFSYLIIACSDTVAFPPHFLNENDQTGEVACSRSHSPLPATQF